MRIRIDNHTIYIDDARFVYDFYHLDVERYKQFNGGSPAEIVSKVLICFAETISDASEECVLFLPYAFDDQWIGAIRATPQNGHLCLSNVQVAENGWAVEFGKLGLFVTEPHALDSEGEVFAVCTRADLIHSLFEAEII